MWDDDRIYSISVYDATEQSDLTLLASGPSGFTDGHVLACKLPDADDRIQVDGGQRGGYVLIFQVTVDDVRVTEAWLANCTWKGDGVDGTFEFVLDSPFGSDDSLDQY